ncbi:MAG: phosphoribosyltransferase family protein [Patescibacteria group bacterium]
MQGNLSESEILRIFEECGVLINGHFILRSGLHSTGYLEKGHLLARTLVLKRLCHAMAELFVDDHVETVVAPAVAGVALSQWIAHHLTILTGCEVFAVFADKKDSGGFEIKRDFDKYIRGRRTLVAEDIVTKGGSVRDAIEITRKAKGDVVGACAIADRGGITASDLGIQRFETLIRLNLPTYNAGLSECPACAAGVAIDTLHGHGKVLVPNYL